MIDKKAVYIGLFIFCSVSLLAMWYNGLWEGIGISFLITLIFFILVFASGLIEDLFSKKRQNDATKKLH